MGKSIYSKDEINNIKFKREIKALSSLLSNINEEEKSIVNKVKRKKPNINYKQSFLITSNIQLYKTYSILGLTKDYTINTKYFVLDLAMLLDIWFNNSQLIAKSSLLKCDILIIHGKAIEYQAGTKATALIELISSRKTLNKLTWLFMEDINLENFNNLYPGVSSTLVNKYQVNISILNKTEVLTETDSTNTGEENG